MGATSTIQWTDATWNPVGGCSVISPGCNHCYARGVAARFSKPGMPYHGLAVMDPDHGPQWTGEVHVIPKHLGDPLHWKRPRRVFVNSMSDLFHEELSNEAIAAVFGVMAAAPQHIFQVLTKRAKRMREWFEWVASFEQEHGPPPDHVVSTCASNYVDCDQLVRRWPLRNVWIGVSVEDQKRADERVPELIDTPDVVRFLSVEPMLGPVDLGDWLSCSRLSWVIVGGESGHGARPFDIHWADAAIRQCKDAGVACFVKQLGAKPFDSQGPIVEGVRITEVSLVDSKGGDMAEWPERLRVREMPETAAS